MRYSLRASVNDGSQGSLLKGEERALCASTAEAGRESSDFSSAASPSSSIVAPESQSRDSAKTGGTSSTMDVVSMACQIFCPFLLAGLGMVTAGLVLDAVVEWEVFLMVPEIFILVPALLGLKGNLEMTLASRLSTQASLGAFDTTAEAMSLIVGNLALIQVQSIVVGCLASVVATFLNYLSTFETNIEHTILLCSSSILTASLASFVLGLIMVFVIVLSRKVGCDPDNVAAPIAASLGDLTTLALLASISNTMWIYKDGYVDESIIIVFCFIIAPCCAWVASRCDNTRTVLYSGWTPVLASMCISSAGGLILDRAIERFPRMAAFQPVINGAGSNLAAVQASRIATHLHTKSELGLLEEDADSDRRCVPWFVFTSQSVHSITARVLIMLVVPGHLMFLLMIRQTASDESAVGPTFISLYLLATLLQEWILLYTCQHLVHFQWKRGIDPDSAAVPYLAALGDLCGSALLLGVFSALTYIDKTEHIADPEVVSIADEVNITSLEAKFLLSHLIRW